MNTTQLQTIMDSNGLTGSVHPADGVAYLQVAKYPAGYIVNTDPATEPGTHWVAFYFPRVGAPGEFFDSYGRPPEYYSSHFVNFLKRNCNDWSFNTVTVQAPSSWVCGNHCLFYIMQRFDGKDPDTIVLNIYSRNNLLYNDTIVKLNVDFSVLDCVVNNVYDQVCRPILK